MLDEYKLVCAWCKSTDLSVTGTTADDSDIFTCNNCQKDTIAIYGIIGLRKKE